MTQRTYSCVQLSELQETHQRFRSLSQFSGSRFYGNLNSFDDLCLGGHPEIWGFPEIGVPLFIIHFRLGFFLTNHPAMGLPALMETPIYPLVIQYSYLYIYKMAHP